MVTPSTVTNDVRALAEGLAQHRVTGEQVRDYCESSARCADGATACGDATRHEAIHDDVAGVANALAARCQLLPIVAAYRDAKRRRECLDFADQMALAADLAEQFPEVARDRAGDLSRGAARRIPRHQPRAAGVPARAVRRPVHCGALARAPLLTAVGDPSQAIYGWRGASQGTLAAFPTQFPDADKPASVLTLGHQFSQRRPAFSPRRTPSPSRCATASFRPRLLHARDDAPDGSVRCGLYPTIDDEAAAIADHVAGVWQARRAAASSGRADQKLAVLVRAWRQLPRIEAALRARGCRSRSSAWAVCCSNPMSSMWWPLAGAGRPDARRRVDAAAHGRPLAHRRRDLATLGRWARRLARFATLPSRDTLFESLRPTSRRQRRVDADLVTEPDPDDVDDAQHHRRARRPCRRAGLAFAPTGMHAWRRPLGRTAVAAVETGAAVARSRRRRRSRTTGLDVEVLARGDAVMTDAGQPRPAHRCRRRVRCRRRRHQCRRVPRLSRRRRGRRARARPTRRSGVDACPKYARYRACAATACSC